MRATEGRDESLRGVGSAPHVPRGRRWEGTARDGFRSERPDRRRNVAKSSRGEARWHRGWNRRRLTLSARPMWAIVRRERSDAATEVIHVLPGGAPLRPPGRAPERAEGKNRPARGRPPDPLRFPCDGCAKNRCRVASHDLSPAFGAMGLRGRYRPAGRPERNEGEPLRSPPFGARAPPGVGSGRCPRRCRTIGAAIPFRIPASSGGRGSVPGGLWGYSRKSRSTRSPHGGGIPSGVSVIGRTECHPLGGWRGPGRRRPDSARSFRASSPRARGTSSPTRDHFVIIGGERRRASTSLPVRVPRFPRDAAASPNLVDRGPSVGGTRGS